MTLSPRRGPGGMAISSSRVLSLSALASASSFSYAPRRALPLACRALGARRTHSSSRASVRWRASFELLLAAQALQLLLEPGRVVALERDAAPAVELEDPLRDVVEEVAVVGDRDDGAGVLLEEALEPVHRLGVEVVGRLVEEQQVGVAEQQPARARRGASRRRTGSLTSASSGGQRRASMAMSTLRSRFQASAAAILSSSAACFAPIAS